MPSKSRRQSEAARDLYHESQLRSRMRSAYYRILNEDADFAAALNRLYDEVRERLPQRAAWDARCPPPAVDRLFDTFTQRWALPRDGRLTPDLWESVRRTREGEPSRLVRAARATIQVRRPWPTYGRGITTMDGTELAIDYVDGERIMHSGLVGQQVLETAGGIISPISPLPFAYEPTRHGPEFVRKYAEDLAELVRRDIVAQAEAIEQLARAQGFLRNIHQAHVDQAELQRLARRLYRRAVLGQGWSQIAEEEAKKNPEGCDPQSVRTTVNSWADALNIALRPLPRGRPRSRK